MSANPERRAEVIFYGALDLLRSERDGLLTAACGEDAALRTEVEELLQMHDGAAGPRPPSSNGSPT